MYKTIITKPAEQDIKQTVMYIAKDLQNPIAASKLLDDIESAISSLESMPKRHRIVSNEQLANLGVRCSRVHNYLIFYIVREKDKSIIIERFIHTRRDWIHIIE